jgi:CRISPR-associated protein Cmr5
MTTAQQNNRRKLRVTTDEDRSRQALINVQEAKAMKKSEQAEYRMLVCHLNSLVQIDGLGHFLAFLKEHGKIKGPGGRLIETTRGILYRQLSLWVSTRLFGRHKRTNDLLMWILTDASREQYRQATAECLAYGVWLRHFAEAELDEGDSQLRRRGGC